MVSPHKSSADRSASRRVDERNKKKNIKSPHRESPNVAPSSKTRKNRRSNERNKEESKKRDLKYVSLKKEASDEAINLKEMLKVEREEMPKIRKRELTASFLPVVFPAGRIYRPGVLVSTIPVTPTETMITEMRERQQRTANRSKGKNPRKYTGVKANKALSRTASASASKSRSNEAKSGDSKKKGEKAVKSKKSGGKR